MNPSQRFTDCAFVGLVANAVLGETMRQDHWPVDRTDNLKRGNPTRGTGEFISAVRPGH